MSNMVINVPPATVGQCAEFIDFSGRPVNGKTVVITPLRVTMVTDESQKISFGCNHWKSCQNKQCSYCQAGMDHRD